MCRESTLNKGRLNSFAKFWRKVLVQVKFTNFHDFEALTRELLGFLHSYGVLGSKFSEINEYYAEVRYERIAILNALGAYYSYLGKIETNPKEKDNHFTSATQYYNKASRIDMHESSTWVGKGMLCSLSSWLYMVL